MRILLLLLLAAPSWSQISSVSTNAAGDRVYFTTYLRPIDSDDGPWGKAYVWTEHGVALVADEGFERADAWQVEGVSPGADGALGVRRWFVCVNSTSCVITRLQEYSELRTADGARELEGHIELAAGGPYAQLRRRTGFGLNPGEPRPPNELQRLRIDDPDAEPEPLGPWPAGAGRWIADDGTMLVDGWRLLAPDGDETPLAPARSRFDIGAAFVAPDASFVAYQAEDGLRLAYSDGTDISLGVSGSLVDLSADGSTLLYTRDVDQTPQAFVMALPGGAERQATDEPVGVDAAAVNGDGSTVFAISGSRLLRVAADGVTETLVGPLPEVEQGQPYLDARPIRPPLVPGSTYRQTGERLTDQTTVAPEPAGTSLDGLEILVDDAPAPILWTSPFEIGFQVPWEAQTADEVFLTVRHRASGWEARVRAPLADRLAQPATERVDHVNLAVHQNFDRLVTPQDPARRGELIHIYATGLGPVEPPVPTGAAAPLDRLTTLSQPCDWRMSIDGPGDAPADVVFAGLAPGLTGFYQIVWRIPEDAAGGATHLYCDSTGSAGVYAVED